MTKTEYCKERILECVEKFNKKDGGYVHDHLDDALAIMLEKIDFHELDLDDARRLHGAICAIRLAMKYLEKVGEFLDNLEFPREQEGGQDE